MSGYKEVEINMVIDNQERLVSVLERVLGAQVEQNVTIKQRWGHPTTVAIAIRQEQLPEELRGFGDIGLNLKNGKFVWLSVSEYDANGYLGEGFFEKITAWQQDVQDGYAATTFKEDGVAASIAPRGTVIGQPEMGMVDGKNCWSLTGVMTEASLAQMGIQVPR